MDQINKNEAAQVQRSLLKPLCLPREEASCNKQLLGTSTAKHGHQRNLSLDFRSMGIVLPPISVALETERY